MASPAATHAPPDGPIVSPLNGKLQTAHVHTNLRPAPPQQLTPGNAEPSTGTFVAESSDASPSSTGATTSPVTSPPYWQARHGRSDSTVSQESVLPEGAITLQDNEQGPERDGGGGGPRSAAAAASAGWAAGRERNGACWAKGVEVTDHVVVNGSATNIGAFVVWTIRVETLSGSYMNIRKRYSEFDDFRRRLMDTFPGFEAAVPELPPKSIIAKFRPRFLEKRRAGLQYFLNCILLNPEFSGSPVLKEFLFA